MGRAFVTGGSGFVGRHLISALRSRGQEVRALVRSDRAAEAVDAAGGLPVRGSLDDLEALREGMAGCEVVYHLAAHIDEWGDPALFRRVNVEGTANVVSTAREEGVPRLVHASTEAVLLAGPPLVEATEAMPLPARPAGLYAATKAEAERVVIAANSSELATTVVRFRYVWGRGDTNVLPKFVRAIQSGRFAWVDGGRYPTSTCHVENAAHGTILAADRGRGGEVYFITDGAPTDFRSFLSAQLEAVGVEPPRRRVPRWLAVGAARLSEKVWRTFRLRGFPPFTLTGVLTFGQQVTVVDAKAREELGYEPVITIEEGLAAMGASRS